MEKNNLVKEKTTDNCDSSPDYIPAASHYALKYAFHALKERCNKLQSRLTVFEKQNIDSKENCNSNGGLETSCQIEILEQKINELSRQKAYLSHHIFMLANENQNLCDEVRKLNKEKQDLVNSLRDLSAEVNNVDKEEKILNVQSTQTTQNLDLEGKSSINSASDEDVKVSLASIETVKDLSVPEAQDGSVPVFRLNNELQDIVEKLNKDKSLLLQQQLGLKTALNTSKKIYQGMKMHVASLPHMKTENKSSIPDGANEGIKQNEVLPLCSDPPGSIKMFIDTGNKAKIKCPFCTKHFVPDTISEECSKHFLHQECSDNELSLKSFEVIV